MAKKQKGNGGAGDDVKKQLEFLDEVKKIAKKHGIDMGGRLAQAVQPDQRQLKIQVREHQGKIVIDFGKSIAWMAMDITQATKFAATVVKLVQQVQNRNAIDAEGGAEKLPATDEAEDPEQAAEGDKDTEAEKPTEKEKVDKDK